MTDKQRNSKDQKMDATGEFFSVGMPLHAVRAGYVRREADQQLVDVLLGGGNAHVIAPAARRALLRQRLRNYRVTVVG